MDLSKLKNFDKEAMDGNDILTQKRLEQDAAMDTQEAATQVSNTTTERTSKSCSPTRGL